MQDKVKKENSIAGYNLFTNIQRKTEMKSFNQIFFDLEIARFSQIEQLIKPSMLKVDILHLSELHRVLKSIKERITKIENADIVTTELLIKLKEKLLSSRFPIEDLTEEYSLVTLEYSLVTLARKSFQESLKNFTDITKVIDDMPWFLRSSLYICLKIYKVDLFSFLTHLRGKIALYSEIEEIYKNQIFDIQLDKKLQEFQPPRLESFVLDEDKSDCYLYDDFPVESMVSKK